MRLLKSVNFPVCHSRQKKSAVITLTKFFLVMGFLGFSFLVLLLVFQPSEYLVRAQADENFIQLPSLDDISVPLEETRQNLESSNQLSDQPVSSPTSTLTPEYAPGTIIVKFRAADSIDSAVFKEARNTYNLNDHKELFPRPGHRQNRLLSNIYTFNISPGTEKEAVDGLSRLNQIIEYAELNYLFQTTQTSSPNDPLYPNQWHLPQVSALQAWGVTTGTSTVTIAVIDTGIEWTHPDFASNIWQNPGEIPNNGIDDDGNGFIDDIRGWDFVVTAVPCWPGEDCLFGDNDPDDFYGHGTGVAGVAAAVTNNGTGVAGICQNCKIMPVRAGFALFQGWPFAPVSANFDLDDIAQALIYAADNDADVINMSFGGYATSTFISAAIAYAYSQGSVLVAAVGNDNTSSLTYPASLPEVIAVAGTNQNDLKTNLSNYGPWVDIAAPGTNIWTTAIPGNNWGCPDATGTGYGGCSGTSFAAPLVSGIIGLALSKNPSLSQDQVWTIIQSATDPLNTLQYIGTGRTNAYKAVLPSTVSLALFDSSMDNLVVPAGMVTNIMGTAAGQNFLKYRIDFGVNSTTSYPSTWTTVQDDTFASVTDGILGTWNPAAFGLAYETVTLRLRVTDTNQNIWEDRAVVRINPLPPWPTINVSGNIFFNTTWTSGNVYVVQGSVTVNPGVTLTIEPGVIVKFNPDTSLIFDGTSTINALGTPLNKIYFTSLRDDSVGGDTNGDGTATTPAPGDYYGIYFNSGSSGALDYASFRYGGKYPSGAVSSFGGSVQIHETTFQYNRDAVVQRYGGDLVVDNSLFLNNNIGLVIDPNTTAPITLTNSRFGGNELYDAWLRSSLDFTNFGNTGIGSVRGFWMNPTGLATDQTLNPGIPFIVLGLINGQAGLYVPDGKTLVVNPGTVIKMRRSVLQVYGTLIAHGTPGQKIYFTSLYDDSLGGDSNGDGNASVPAPGDYYGIAIGGTGIADIDSVTAQFGGKYWCCGVPSNGVIRIYGGNVSLTNSRLNNNNNGIQQTAGTTTVSYSSIYNNISYGIYNSGTNAVSAQNNWWGTPSGPYHPTLNPSGAGNQISNNVNFNPWLAFDPDEPPPIELP